MASTNWYVDFHKLTFATEDGFIPVGELIKREVEKCVNKIVNN